MKVKVSSVMPRSFRGKNEIKNLDKSLHYIDEAVETGSKLILLPEGYPGPYNGEYNWNPEAEICKKAEEHQVYIIYGTLDQASNSDKYYLSTKVASPAGRIIANYYRMQPNQPEVDNVLMNNKKIIPGEDFCIVETPYGKIGLLICSEIWCAELPKILALFNVDILFAPIGGMVYELKEAWECLLWSRAIENHMYVVTCQHLYGMESGIGMIAGPEEILAKSDKEGIITAELDMNRLNWLRTHDQTLELPKQYKSIPGLLKYRRPEKYSKLTEQDKRAYNFNFYE